MQERGFGTLLSDVNFPAKHPFSLQHTSVLELSMIADR